jgi:tetratricopeptide (TPR) repeat protein
MKQRYNLKFFALSFMLTVIGLASCEDMLQTGSDRLVFDDEYQLKDPNDPFYIISGILAEVQKVGDRYVILGELRGDLMKTSDQAALSLQEINNFEVSPGNEYTNRSDYYSIINNCNYALQRMDTTLNIRSEKIMLPVYAEIKTIRAWTYFQMAQIYGKAIYLTEPVLDLESSLAAHTPVALDEIVERLIQDLLPYVGRTTVSDLTLVPTFLSLDVLLGDLYLYQNKYEQAAAHYYREIYNERWVISANNVSRWNNATFETAQAYHTYAYSGSGNEIMAEILFHSDPKQLHSQLVRWSLNDKPSILPVENYISFMSSATYLHAEQLEGNVTAYGDGDLRGNLTTKLLQAGDAWFNLTAANGGQQNMPLIFKYFCVASRYTGGSDPDNNLLTEGLTYSTDGNSFSLFAGLAYLTYIPIYRTPHLYLRFAEAVNRSGMPTLAFAVLKYGLTSANINNPARVNPSEAGIYDFQASDFNTNIPMAARGRGYGVVRDESVFVIPDYALNPDLTVNENARQDTILWVEERILEELSAETAFEGNRFFDLLRISRRHPNHPEYMAEKVSAKYGDSRRQALKTRLMNPEHWFLP